MRTPALLLLLASLLPARAAWAGEAEVAGAVVRWERGLDALGRQAVRAIPAVRDQVRARLGFDGDEAPVEVVLVEDHGGMVRAAGAAVPTWAVGVAVSTRSLIVIRSDLLSRGWGGGLEPVLRHEWVHLAWGRRGGPHRRDLPLWAEEGLAEEIGGAVSVDAGLALDRAVAFGNLLDFRAIEVRFPADAQTAGLAYRQSRSLMRFLAGEAGWDAVRRILARLADPEPAVGAAPPETPFARAVRLETGSSVGEWETKWRARLEAETPPWYLLLFQDVASGLLTVLAVFAVVAFFFLWARRRRQIARLPDEPGGPPEGV